VENLDYQMFIIQLKRVQGRPKLQEARVGFQDCTLCGGYDNCSQHFNFLAFIYH